MSQAATQPPPHTQRIWPQARRLLAYALAVTLLALAIYVVATRPGPTVAEILKSVQPAQAAALLILPLGNWALTGLMFFVLTGAFPARVPVRFSEMLALIGSSWLLNYLPLQPGLVGRVAYHKSVNGITVKHSLIVIALSLGCTLAAAAIMLSVVALMPTIAGNLLSIPAEAAIAALGFVITPALVLGVLAWALHKGAPARIAWRVVTAVGLRYLDMSLAAVRYWVAFSVLGTWLTAGSAATVAAGAQVAMLPPLPFGLREWTVQWLSSALIERATAGPTGLTVDLLNRAAEVAVAVPVGLVCSVWLLRRQRRLAVIGAPAAAPGSSA